MTTATPAVTDEQAAILAAHATIVQGGFSTPAIERERILKDAAGQPDPQAFIDETVGKFATEVLQAQLAQPVAPATSAAPSNPDLPGGFGYMGETIDIPREQGWRMLAEYRAAAAQLHEAKARAKAIEQEIMQVLQGFEEGKIDGQTVFTWKFVDSTAFDTKAFKEDPQRKALYEQFLVTKPSRRFKVDGTVGVD